MSCGTLRYYSGISGAAREGSREVRVYGLPVRKSRSFSRVATIHEPSFESTEVSDNDRWLHRHVLKKDYNLPAEDYLSIVQHGEIWTRTVH